MDILESALDDIAGVRTLLGLLALLAIVLARVALVQQKSILDRIGRSGLSGAQVLEILRTYQDDEARTKALVALLRHEKAMTDAGLETAARRIQDSAVLLRTYSHGRRVLMITGTILILLALLGYFQASADAGEGERAELPETSRIALPNTPGKTDSPRGPPEGLPLRQAPPRQPAPVQHHSPDTLVAQARVRLEQRKFGEAFRLFDQAQAGFSERTQLDPELIGRAKAAYARNDFRTAARVYDSVFPRSPPR